jgi:hypothetical protein
MTSPEATLLLDCVVTVPTVRPAPVIAVVAAACVSPATLGTLTCVLPLPPESLDPPHAASAAAAIVNIEPLMTNVVLLTAIYPPIPYVK